MSGDTSSNTNSINEATAYIELCYRWNCKHCGHKNRRSEISCVYSCVCEGCGNATKIVEIVQGDGKRLRVGR